MKLIKPKRSKLIKNKLQMKEILLMIMQKKNVNMKKHTGMIEESEGFDVDNKYTLQNITYRGTHTVTMYTLIYWWHTQELFYFMSQNLLGANGKITEIDTDYDAFDFNIF
ncbi:hypothetical protein [Anaerobium acetethylicum]|nr:hypothetical protein [Anaerobium acetethylicum]